MANYLFFTGGYTETILMGTGERLEGRCRGIGCYLFDPESGHAELLNRTDSTPNPSYILVGQKDDVLYCVNELKSWNGVGGSTVSAYRFDRRTGGLTLIARQAVCGEDACHLSLTKDGSFLLVSNYSGGSVCMLPVRPDGGLSPACCLIQHVGHSTDSMRQSSPHPHQTLPSPDGKHIFVPDLGIDQIKCYLLDETNKTLVPKPGRDIQGIPGQGIRHGVFAAGGSLYVMTELACEINFYAHDRKSDAYTLRQIQACFHERPEPGSSGAAIRLDPAGRYVYASVRGTDELFVFEIGCDGCLIPRQCVPCGGRTPREFTISPDGGWLLSANQDSDSITVHAIDRKSGMLSLTSEVRDVPSVTTVAFAPDPNL